MDTARYVVAVLLVISLPAALGYWFLVHPFIGFWRRLGPRTSFIILALFFIVTLVVAWLIRATLVGRDLGTSTAAATVGAVLYAGAVVITLKVRRHLRFAIMAGLPEIRGTGGAGALLDQGIYAKVRHPRYLAVVIGGVGMALFANYLGVYVMTALMMPVLYALILFEERELVTRFGDVYREYQRTVPRLIPRW